MAQPTPRCGRFCTVFSMGSGEKEYVSKNSMWQHIFLIHQIIFGSAFSLLERGAADKPAWEAARMQPIEKALELARPRLMDWKVSLSRNSSASCTKSARVRGKATSNCRVCSWATGTVPRARIAISKSTWWRWMKQTSAFDLGRANARLMRIPTRLLRSSKDTSKVFLGIDNIGKCRTGLKKWCFTHRRSLRRPQEFYC